MGTKNSPGAYDCWAKAEDDEPMFVLLARDEGAPALVEEWAAWRESIHGWGPDADPHETAKIAEARDCAAAMRTWREEHRP